MQTHDKLFIPGPVEVSEKTWTAFTRPLIGHRSEDFKNLYSAIHPGLQRLFGTKQPVFLSTSSAWGVMEASIRNLGDRGVLCCMCGAFSDKWFDVAKRCGKNAEALQVDWGKHIDPKAVDRQLATGKFDTVTLTHSETSTGVMNPLEEICSVLAKYPDVVLIVDTVDFLEFKKEQAQWMTPSTPSIGHIHALQFKLEEISEEGLEARFARHARTNALVHDWVRRTGFDFFAEEGFRSKTLTCVKNNKGIDVLEFARKLREKHHLVIDPGYGKIRGQTFRLSNMGDETEETVSHLLACLDDVL